MKFRTNMFCFFSLLSLFFWAYSSIAQGTEIEGKYSHDIVNFILFEEGQFNEQYVTDGYIPAISLEESDGPSIERETICLARGTYTITASSIHLLYEVDSCNIEQGVKTVNYEIESDTIIINNKIYRRSDSDRLGDLRLRSVDQNLSVSDVEAGLKSWQWHVAQAMQDLNNNENGIWYCSHGAPNLDSTYWTWSSSVGAGGWIPNIAEVEPSAAINWYFGSVSAYAGCTECLMAARASFYKGLLETIGRTAFNNWFNNNNENPQLVISYNGHAPSSTRMNKPILSETDLDRGDWVYFQNWVSASGCPDINPMQGENAITQDTNNPRTYIGLGMPGRGGEAITGQDILTHLRDAWQRTECPQEREGKLRTNNVSTASPTYFSDIANGLSLLNTLQNSVPVSNLSGQHDSRKFYKFIVPSGTSGFEVRTSGGTGDSDVYVMRDQWPTTMLYDYKSDLVGNAEVVTINENPSGTWYIMLDGHNDYSGVTIVARYGSSSPCGVNPILLNSTANDSWESGCNSTHRSGRNAKYYSFSLSSIEEIQIDLESSQDTYLMLLSGNGLEGNVIAQDDDGGRGYNSKIIYTLPAGTYTIEATTYSSGIVGDFNITVATNTPSDDCVDSINFNQAVSGSWESSCESTNRQDRYAKYYTFTLSSSQWVTIDLQSPTDTYLFLLRGAGKNGSVIAQDDDGGRGHNSKIFYTLSAGTYTIEATTYSSGAVGDFNITVATNTPSDDCVDSINFNQAVSGSWESSCESTNRQDRYAKYYTFTLSSGHWVTIDLQSSTDTYLFLLRGSGENGSVIAHDDDGGRGHNSKIFYILSAGTYTIEATTYSSGAAGNFVVSIQ